MSENRTSKVILVAACLAGAGLAGLAASDFLPPTIERDVVLAALCSLGLGAAAIAASLAVIVRRAALEHSRRFGFTLLVIAILTASLFLGMAVTWGVRPSVFCFVVVAQLVTPVFVTRYYARSDSALVSAIQGAGAALVSFAVLGILYILVIGIEGGYPFGDIGPGLRGLGDLGDLMALLVIGVWPIPVVLLAGAVGGILGWKLRIRRARNRPSGERGGRNA